MKISPIIFSAICQCSACGEQHGHKVLPVFCVKEGDFHIQNFLLRNEICC